MKTVLLLCALVAGSSNLWATDITYTFTAADWKATCGGASANWTSGKAGGGFGNNGVQVTTNNTNNGANATSPSSFTKISKIVVTYNTNKSAGAGSIKIQIGTNNETSNDVAYSGSADGRSANFTTEYNYATAQTGNVKITVNTTTNSIYVVSIKITYTPEDDGKVDPTLSFSQASYSVDLGNEFESPTLTRDADGTGTVTYSSSNTNVATVNSTTGAVTVKAVGSTTITASVAADEKYRAGSAQYVLNVTFAVTDGVFDFEKAGATSPLTDYGSGVTLSSDPYTTEAKTWTAVNVTMATSGKYRWWNADKTLRFYDTSYMEFSVPDGYVITKIDHSAGTLSNPSVGSMSGSSWVGASQSVKLQASGNFKSVTVTYTTATQSETVQSYGWATYIPKFNVQFAENTAYVVTDASVANGLTLAPVTQVPAGTPLLLKGAGEKSATVIASASAPATNLLTVCNGTIPDGKDAWVLAKNGAGKAGFKQWTGDDSALEGRVVLLLDEAEASRGFIDFDENDVTGISVSLTNSEKVNNAYYNLAGQRVAKPTKGLYIVNGKKVIIK